jgi:hypothetical protein
MKICSWCGKQSDDEAAFCPKCGNALMGAIPVTRPTKKDRMPMYVGAFLVALVAVIAVFGAATLYNVSNNWTSDPSASHVSMSVQGVSWTNSTEHPAPNGQRYLVVTATLHSDRGSEIFLTPSQFVLSTSQGNVYSFNSGVDWTMGTKLVGGTNQTISLAFLVPENAVPTMLTFFIVEDMGVHVHAPI